MKKFFSSEIHFFYDKSFENPSEVTGEMPDLSNFERLREKLRTKQSSTSPEMRMFFQEPLLSKEQEFHCFRKMDYYKFCYSNTLDESLKDGILTLRTQLTKSNMKLMFIILKKQPLSWLTELIVELEIALVRAVDGFDWRRGFKFSTYATISMVRAAKDFAERTKKYSDRFRLMRKPPDKLIEDFRNDEYEELYNAIASLDANRRDVICHFFGVGTQRKILSKIAEIMGITRDRAYRLKKEGLNRLANFMYAQH